MNTKKTKTENHSVSNADGAAVKKNFKPQLNGSYRVQFGKESSSAGFATLLKGGLFHRLPNGFVITKKHKDLLDKEEIPYTEIKD